jgi:all-trans-8'-apo-beta-carotenal 15,15'-oxygenase
MVSIAAPIPVSAPGPAWPSSGFLPQRERDIVVDRIDGRLPDDLLGVFYRVGPGALDVAGSPNAHWFDGDGMVCAFRLEKGRVSFTNRFVETPWRARERQAGRRLFSAFAAVAPTLRGHLRRPKTPANTNVVSFAGRLLALYEGGRPFALAPRSLETIGEEDFEGTLPRWATFSAHPHMDPETGALVSVGLGFRPGARGIRPVAEVWEVSREGRARRGRSIPLRRADVIHSVGLTRSKIVLLVGPYGLDARRIPGLFMGRHGIFDSVAWRPRDPLAVYVADREGNAAPEVYELPAAFVIHIANAYEEGQGIVADAVLHPDPELVESVRLPMRDPRVRAGPLARVRIENRRARVTPLSDIGLEFPMIRLDRDGRKHRYVYAGSFERRDGSCGATSVLVKVDTETGLVREHDLGEGCCFGEPAVVSRPGALAEDDAWVLSLGYDARAHRSFLAVLRADAWDEIARVHLPFHVPIGLHASFARA